MLVAKVGVQIGTLYKLCLGIKVLRNYVAFLKLLNDNIAFLKLLSNFI